MKSKKSEIIIVDENDIIISYKTRDKIKQNDIYRVSALWIKNSQDDILLAQRGLNKKNDPGQWGPAVAGTNDRGESYEENIIKEAEEEIGLNNFDFEVAEKLRRTGKYNFFCQWFTRDELKKEIKINRGKYLTSLDYCLKNL